MIVFLAMLMGFIIFGTIAWIAYNLTRPPRDWEADPWNTRETAKTALAVGLAAKAYKDHKDGNGVVATWMGTSTKERERAARLAEREKNFHINDPKPWS